MCGDCFVFLFQIIDVAAGGWHSLAVSAFNDLYAWGWNVNGQIGQPLYKTYKSNAKNDHTPYEKQKRPTVFASPIIVNLSKISDDEHNTTDDYDEQFSVENQYHAVAVSAGARHTIVKVEEGIVLAAGWNKYGQLGSHKLSDDIDRFHVIDCKNVSNNASFVCGEWSTFALPVSI